MPRKKYCPSADLPYHITARCINREWFSLPMEEVWEIFSRYLFFLHHSFEIRIHAFVLMNNHYHLIAQTPQANLRHAMNYFQGETSRQIGLQTGRINQIYGAPYHWSILGTNHYYLYAYKYLYRNPVDAGLCNWVEAYPYSTLYSLLGRANSIIPVVEDRNLFENTESHLHWLNLKYPTAEARLEVKKALRQRNFKFPKDKGRKPHAFDLKLL